MKNVILIIFAILLVGCVPVREDGPALDAKEVLNCPDIIEAVAKNLEQYDIDPMIIQAWRSETLSKEMHPCSACQKLNTATLILNDENGIYKPAMLDFIQDVDEEDPNNSPKVKPYISDSDISNEDMKKYALAQQYLRAIDDLQSFLITEVRMSSITVRNFVLDSYFIPLLQVEQEVEDPNKPAEEVVVPQEND